MHTASLCPLATLLLALTPLAPAALLLPALTALPALRAQSLTVDYPDAIVAATAGQYPIYTGTGTTVIRGQMYCSGTFTGMPTVPMLCAKVGVQLGPPSAGYAQFVLRMGAVSLGALTTTWATNLPDQRVQLDLSNTTINPPNPGAWVEYPLLYPFLYLPGQAVVLDIISQAQVAGIYCRTAIGSSIPVPRLIDTNFLGGTTGPGVSTGGIKFRMVFEPVGMVRYGDGCPGTGSFVPAISSTGQSTLGSVNYFVNLSNALGGSAAVFTLGNPGSSFDLGNGCKVYNDLAATLAVRTSGAGPGTGTASVFLLIPNVAALLATVVDTQYGVFDPSSPAIVPVALTPSGKVVLY